MRYMDKYGSGFDEYARFNRRLGSSGLQDQNRLRRYSLNIPPADGTLAVPGSALRTPSCIGPAVANGQTTILSISHTLTQEFQDEMHRPVFLTNSR